MVKFNEENERVKRQYGIYLVHYQGKDQSTCDKALAAIYRFEESTKFKAFKKFHRNQAVDFKEYLVNLKNQKTGKPLGHSTVDSILRAVKGFFQWLACQSGFKRVLTYDDAQYFNNTLKAGRIAHTKRDIPHPTMEQAAHAFQAMPDTSEFDKRNRAVFAFFMLTGARDGAVASLKLKHINVDLGHVYQDARDVKTKNSKTIDCQFFPVDQVYHDCFKAWVAYLKQDKLFGPDDALFPKAKIGFSKGQGFTNLGLSRDGYANSGPLNKIIRESFASVQMRQFTPHSFRKTLAKYGNEVCDSMADWKAWSMNLGHENIATTINSYMPMTTQEQLERMKKLEKKKYDAGA